MANFVFVSTKDVEEVSQTDDDIRLIRMLISDVVYELCKVMEGIAIWDKV